MARNPRFQYSRWDGTQVGFDLDADAVLEEITDDLLYHGDLNAALRRMMQQGFEDRNGERRPGHARPDGEARGSAAASSSSSTTSAGVYDDIAEELREVVDRSAPGSTSWRREARESGDDRRQELTDQVVAERNLQLDLLPPDLAGQVRELQNYEFTSSEAPREVRRAASTSCASSSCSSYFDQMSGRHAGHVRPRTCSA